ncbi:MAG: hypothetical protein ACYS1A_18200 [Planctomycetota bacterium]|jgi:hypothetical protein
MLASESFRGLPALLTSSTLTPFLESASSVLLLVYARNAVPDAPLRLAARDVVRVVHVRKFPIRGYIRVLVGRTVENTVGIAKYFLVLNESVGMSKKTFRGVLIADNGFKSKKFAWFHQTSQGFYTGGYLNNLQFHSSYHTDGKNHQIIGDKPSPWKYGQRLDKFVGWELLSITAFNKNDIPGKPYKKKKKVDVVKTIDIRDYPHDTISTIWAFFEVGRTDLIKEVSKSWLKGELFLFKQTTPWLVIYLVTDEKPLIEMDEENIYVSGIANEKGKHYEFTAFG